MGLFRKKIEQKQPSCHGQEVSKQARKKFQCWSSAWFAWKGASRFLSVPQGQFCKKSNKISKRKDMNESASYVLNELTLEEIIYVYI